MLLQDFSQLNFQQGALKITMLILIEFLTTKLLEELDVLYIGM